MSTATNDEAAIYWSDVILGEYTRAAQKFPPFSSYHEGYAVLLEEVDELWEEVKKNDRLLMMAEVKQVAAMALRFLVDLSEKR